LQKTADSNLQVKIHRFCRSSQIRVVGGKQKTTDIIKIEGKMAIKIAKENFSNLTTEDLIKKKKATTMVTGVLAGMLTVLLIMATLLAISQGLTGVALIAVALSLSPILFMNYNSIKTINAELKSRNPS
jgi:hypothetical protein